MLLVVCYDIANEARLRKVAREMENFGLRVQRSVFECHLDPAQLRELQARLARILEPTDDTVRYYRLCGKDAASILVDGKGEVSRDSFYHIV